LSEADPAVDAVRNHYRALDFPASPAGRPYLYVNMVASVDGKVTVDGSERGLGSSGDKRLMQELRAHADAVINGAQTLRVSGSTPLVRPADLKALRGELGRKPQPLGVVISASGDLPLDVPFFTSPAFDALVILTTETPAERVAAIRATGRHVGIVPGGRENGTAIAALLYVEYGVRYALVEGGPTLNATLFHANVVDELFVTAAPWLVGGRESLTLVEGTAFHRETMPRLQLRGVLHSAPTDELFLRYTVERRA
jgi:2,5-diamino-6-(ribosylamino)-4(3H)-pyrimidinone 5'-phosphate reductase